MFLHIIITAHSRWIDKSIGIEWFMKCLLLESMATLVRKYWVNGHASHANSKVITLCEDHVRIVRARIFLDATAI